MSARAAVAVAVGAGVIAVLTIVSGVLIEKLDAGWQWWVALVPVGLVTAVLTGLVTFWLMRADEGRKPPVPPDPIPEPGNSLIPSDLFGRIRGEIIDLRPLESVLDLTHFTGREWLIEFIDAHIAHKTRGYVVVEAEAGVGKTTLAAHLARTRSYPYHFTRLEGGRSPELARRSLAAQLIVEWQLDDLASGTGAERPDWLLKVLTAAAAKRDADHPGRPLVLIVDSLDEADDAPGRRHDTGTDVPLGLPRPEDLPTGVFIVATCRVGTPLPALYPPLAVPYRITAIGSKNRKDMKRFLADAVTGASPRRELVDILQADRVDPQAFVESLLNRCGGVWIYLRYVLNDILAGRRSPADVQTLPEELIGYYLKQIYLWRDDPESWQYLRLPVVATLVALRRPATRAEIASLAGVDDGEKLQRWLDEQGLRSFLNVTPDSDGQALYVVLHDSLRELFASSKKFDERDGTRRALYEALRAAHQRITAALLPPGSPGERDWRAVDAYTRASLAEHAAYSRRLDELACDPGFLLVCDAASLLRHRASVTTDDARAAIAAYELVLDQWARCDDDELRLWWLHVWARKTRSHSLADHAATQHPSSWQVMSAMWTGSSHRTLTGHTEPVRTVCALPLPTLPLLASAGLDRVVRLWNPAAGEQFNQLIGYAVNALGVVSLSDVGNVLVSGGADGKVRLWHPVRAEQVGPPLTGHTAEVNAVCALTLPGGRSVLASASLDGTVRLWNPDNGEEIGQLIGNTELVNALCAVSRSDEGDMLVCVGADGTVRFWDPGTREQLDHPLAEHTSGARAVCTLTLPDGLRIFASASLDGTVRLWDPDSGEQVGPPLTGHTDGVSAVCAVPLLNRRSLLAAASHDRVLRLWDPISGDQVGPPLTGHTDEVRAVCALVLPDGRSVVASAGGDRVLRLWDLDSVRQASPPLAGHTDEVRAVCAVPLLNRPSLLASAGHDRVLRLWDPISGDQVGPPLTGHTDGVSAVCALTLSDGRTVLASGGVDGTVRLWDPDRGDQSGWPLAGHTGEVRALCPLTLSDGRRVFASASLDGTVRLWDPDSGMQVGPPLAGHTNWVSAVCEVVLPDGRRRLASAGDDRVLRLWDPDSGQQVGAPLAGHTGGVSAMCTTLPDGRGLLASAGDDPMLRLWDPVSGEQAGRVLTGHTDVVCAVVLPDGRNVLASGGVDGTVRLWDPETGEQLDRPLAGHTGRVTAVCPLPQPDGHTLMATAGADRTVLVWACVLD